VVSDKVPEEARNDETQKAKPQKDARPNMAKNMAKQYPNLLDFRGWDVIMLLMFDMTTYFGDACPWGR
jgi:hypothetical protein